MRISLTPLRSIGLTAALAVSISAFFLTTTPHAYAASTGCAALNAGGGDTVIPLGTVINTVLNETLDAGEKITITITGNPNSVRIGTNPGNIAVSAAPGNVNVMITLAAGITGITISGQAAAGTNTLVALRCTSVATSTTTTSNPTGPTPEEMSDAVESSNSAVNTVRQPTVPSALPGVDTGASQSPADQEYENLNVEIGALDTENTTLEDRRRKLETQIDELVAQGSPDVAIPMGPEQKARELFTKEDAGDFGGAHDQFVAGFNGNSSTVSSYGPSTQGHQYRDWYQQQMTSIETGLAEADLLTEFHQLQSLLLQTNTKRNEVGQELTKLRIRKEKLLRQFEAEDAKRSPPPPYQWFTGAAGGNPSFNVSVSSDMLRNWAQASLDETEAPETVLPPLTIAGMPVNIWVRGRGTIFDAQNRFGNDGWAGHVLSGIALKTNEKITVGAFGSYLTSSTETKFNNSEIDSTSVGGGAYINMKLVDTISAGLSINREVGEQDIKIGTTTGTADTGLTAVGASLQGSWFIDPVFVSPSLSVSYSDYIREKYTDSTGTLIPSSRSRDTTIAAAATASRTYSFEEGGWFTSASPRVSATVNYFARENRSLRVSTTQIIDLTDWGGNVGTGVTLATEGNSTISIDLGVIGIGQDTLGYTGQLQVDFGF